MAGAGVAVTGRHRRRLAAAALLVLGPAGCTPGATDQDPGPDRDGPPVSSSATEPGTGPTGFPATPREYAERAVAAWAAPDPLRLADLATPQVRREIVELPGPPDLTWRFLRCEPGPADSDCYFYNQDGARLMLTVDHRRLGEPHAAVAMSFDVTRYPDGPSDYLAAFLAAWQDGNLARMHRLATPEVVDVYARFTPPPEVAYEVEPDGPVVEVVVDLGSQGEVVTGVSTALLGQPQAVRTAALAPVTG